MALRNKVNLFIRGELLIDSYWTVLGQKIHFRVEPKAFQDDLKKLERYAEYDEKTDHSKANDAFEAAYKRWGCDPEIIRLETFHSCMEPFDDDSGVEKDKISLKSSPDAYWDDFSNHIDANPIGTPGKK